MLKLKCTVVVPNTTPVAIIGELMKENAEVIQEGANWKEAHAKAESIVANYPRVSRLVHPFDSAILWSGYESIVDEIITDMKGARLDMIVLSVGGGGLLNGVAQGITKNKLNKTTAILAMETEGAACFNQSMSVNRIVSIVPNSIATSLGASSVSARTWELYCNKEFHLFSKTCSDAEAVEACCQFLGECSFRFFGEGYVGYAGVDTDYWMWIWRSEIIISHRCRLNVMNSGECSFRFWGKGYLGYAGVD